MNNYKLVYIFIGFIVLLIFGISPLYQYGTIEKETIKIERLEQVTAGSGENQKNLYLVYAENSVYKNADSFYHLKFNSSTVWGKLKKGKCYRVTSWGWRVPFLSWYPNIKNPTEVSCK